MIDPQKGNTRCIQYALEKLGASPPPASELEWCIGPPLLDSLAKLLNDPGDEVVQKALRLYRERFEAKGLYENTLYPSIVKLLGRIQERGWRVYVVTSKPQPYAQSIVDHFALTGFFFRVYGSRLDGVLADKRDLIRYVLEQEFITPADAVRDALANGAAVIGVTYGYGNREELSEAGTTWFCDDSISTFDTLTAHFRDQGIIR